MDLKSTQISLWSEQDFEFFVRSHSVLFHSFVSRFISDMPTIQDVVQDVLFKLWQDRAKLSHINDYKLFVLTMLKNRALNIIRENKSSIHESLNADNLDKTDLFNELVTSQTFTIIATAIDALPKRYAEVMRLVLSGMKNEDIAHGLGLSLDSVKAIKGRSFKKLKDMLPEDIMHILILICGL